MPLGWPLSLNKSMSPGCSRRRSVIGGANAVQMAWVWCGTLTPMPAKANTISPEQSKPTALRRARSGRPGGGAVRVAAAPHVRGADCGERPGGDRVGQCPVGGGAVPVPGPGPTGDPADRADDPAGDRLPLHIGDGKRAVLHGVRRLGQQ